MSQSFRHPDILEIARSAGKVTVDGLARHFGVTVQTIRRDLADLAETGALTRVHGGAVIPSGVTQIAYGERRALNAEAKTAIAQAVARTIPQETSLFLNIGTTAEAVARALLRHRRLFVVTNNLNVAATLGENRDCEVVLTGGRFRASDGGLVGGLARRGVEEFQADIAVIGCSALSAEGEILDFDLEEVEVSRAILRRARTRFLVADASKFRRQAPARIGTLAEIDKVFTDAPVPPPLMRHLEAWNTEVVLAG